MTLTEWGPFNLFADLGLVNKPATGSEGYLCSEWHIQILQNICFTVIFCNKDIPAIESLVSLLRTQLEILYGSN